MLESITYKISEIWKLYIANKKNKIKDLQIRGVQLFSDDEKELETVVRNNNSRNLDKQTWASRYVQTLFIFKWNYGGFQLEILR